MTVSGTCEPPGASVKTTGRPSWVRARAGKRARRAERSGTVTSIPSPRVRAGDNLRDLDGDGRADARGERSETVVDRADRVRPNGLTHRQLQDESPLDQRPRAKEVVVD